MGYKGKRLSSRLFHFAMAKEEKREKRKQQQRECGAVKDVLVLTVDGDGKAYLQKRGEKFQTFSLGWEQPVW